MSGEQVLGRHVASAYEVGKTAGLPEVDFTDRHGAQKPTVCQAFVTAFASVLPDP